METNESIGTWLTRLFDRVSVSDAYSSVIMGGAVFLLGLVIASFWGLAGAFSSSRVFWLGPVGIAWVSKCIALGCREYPELLGRIYKVVSVDAGTDREVRNRLNAMRKTSSHVLLTIPTAAAAIAYFYFVLRGFCTNPTVQRVLGFPRILPRAFYRCDNLPVTLLIISIYVFVGGLLVVTAVSLFWHNLGILRVLSRGQFQVPFVKALFSLRVLGTFHVKLSLTWFLGIVLVVVMLEQQFTLLVSLFLVLLSLIGVAMFFIPQNYFHTQLEQTKEELEKEIDLKLLDNTPDFPRLDDSTLPSVLRAYVSLRLKSDVSTLSTWPFDFSVLSQLLISLSVPLVIIFLKLST